MLMEDVDEGALEDLVKDGSDWLYKWFEELDIGNPLLGIMKGYVMESQHMLGEKVSAI